VLPRDDGGFDLRASLDGVTGAEVREILAHHIDAQWRADWADAHDRLGDSATTRDLRRTEPQRRADALVAMARAAAATPNGPGPSQPTVNVLIDEATFEATLRRQPIETARYRELVSRTGDGHELHPHDAVNTALWAHVRRVVCDSAGVVIDLGRRSRLFEGSSRTAVMLLERTCAWVGCDRPSAWCHADHSVSWKQHGATVPRNGGPLCPAHNLLKERGFRVHRDEWGTWHTIDPSGAEID
jgi:hypothetical protein